MSNQDPIFLQSVDPDGNAIALIRQEGEGKFIILSPANQDNDLPSTVEVSEVTGQDELRSKVSGSIVPTDADTFNAQLDVWGYDGSAQYRAGGQISAPEEATSEGEAEQPDGAEIAPDAPADLPEEQELPENAEGAEAVEDVKTEE